MSRSVELQTRRMLTRKVDSNEPLDAWRAIYNADVNKPLVVVISNPLRAGVGTHSPEFSFLFANQFIQTNSQFLACHGCTCVYSVAQVTEVFIRHADRAIFVPELTALPPDLVAHREALAAPSIADLGLQLVDYQDRVSKYFHVYSCARNNAWVFVCETFARDVNCGHQRAVRSLLGFEAPPGVVEALYDPSRKKGGRPRKGSAAEAAGQARKAEKMRRVAASIAASSTAAVASAGSSAAISSVDVANPVADERADDNDDDADEDVAVGVMM